MTPLPGALPVSPATAAALPDRESASDAAPNAAPAATSAAAPAPVLPAPAPTWWRRTGFDVTDGRLTLDGASLENLARDHGTPLFAYDLARPVENVRALQAALDRAGLRHVVRFALKSGPDPRILAVLRDLGAPGEPGSIGIDACSPGEVLHALANGWEPDEISHTGTNVSDRDLDVLLTHPIRLNLDGVSQLERVGRRAPGRTVGIRINPGSGAGYTDKLSYAGERPTKFGVTADRLDDAIATVRRHGLVVDTLHFHAGSGWLGDQLGGFEAALARATGFLDRFLEAGFPVREVNVGGGVGRVARDVERPVDLDAYAALVARYLRPYGVAAAFEPGDLVLKDAGVLLGEVVSVERRGGVTFVGLDLGWNVNCAHFIYGYAQEILPVRDPLRPRTQLVTVAGHINEAGDVFAEDYPFPDVAEGEIVAILNAGGYLQAMSMTHCLRPTGSAVYLNREPHAP
jgi:diaminopimelate decarboxylase